MIGDGSIANVKAQRDLTSGPLFVPMIKFVIPIMLTGMLQICYNMADNIVVGRYSGDSLALAAVGSTSALANLIINLLMGIAGGAGVLIAQCYGAKDHERLSKAVHTSMLFALFGGLFFCLFGFIIAKPALALMGTKTELMSRAYLYLRIICLGIPASAVYNFGAAVLRSVGDSKTPLYILSSTGVVNVILNLVFVILFGMSVDGVALATIIAQYISAVTVVLILFKRKESVYSLGLGKMHIDRELLGRMLKLGLPAGFQGSLFSISNIIITGGINTLPTEAISGKTIAINIEGLVYTAMNSYLHASMTFTGQNYGARNPERIKKSILYAIVQVSAIGIIGGQFINLLGRPIASLYIDPTIENSDLVMNYTLELMGFMLSVYFLCGIMDTLSGGLRGLGYSIIPMIISIFAICVLRTLWVLFVFPTESFHSLIGIYIIYPISWLIGAGLLVITLIFVYKKIKVKFASAENDTKVLADEA